MGRLWRGVLKQDCGWLREFPEIVSRLESLARRGEHGARFFLAPVPLPNLARPSIRFSFAACNGFTEDA
jgi:hypothetical protein